MAERGLRAEIKALQRVQRHLLWLRANLGEHSITVRAERELIVQRARLALAAGDAVARTVQPAGELE